MADDRKQELDRLEQELLADAIPDDDDLLADIPISLLDSRPIEWDEDIFEEELPEAEEFTEQEEIVEDDDLLLRELLAEVEEELATPPEETEETKPMRSKKQSKDSKKKSDRLLIILMTIASFLCVGIIGMLIYWLEAFLK